MKRIVFFAVFPLFCIATHPCRAAHDSLGSYSSERILFASASTGQAPAFVKFDADRLRPAYSPRKARVAKRLMIAGGACLMVGIPLLIYAVAEDKVERQSSTGGNHFPRSLAFGFLGGVATGVGLGLSIPGAILWHRNQGRLQGAR